MLGNGVCLSEIHHFTSGLTWENAQLGAFPVTRWVGVWGWVVRCWSKRASSSSAGKSSKDGR